MRFLMPSRARAVPWSATVRRCRAKHLVIHSCLLSATILSPTHAQTTDCQCRAPDGTMRDLGTVECVDIVGTRNMVRCEMSTNTPYWRKLNTVEGCPSA